MTTVALRAFQQPGVAFDAATHRYTYYGSPVPNVTTIDRDHKISADWSQVPGDVLAQKREIGLAAHAASHYFDEGDLDVGTVHPAAVPYMDAWRLFREEQEFEPILLETPLVHPVRRYGGTVDRFGIVHRLQRFPSVVDIKTGDPDDAGAGPQTAAYEQLIRAVLPELWDWLLGEAEPAGGELPWTFDELQDEPWTRYSVQLLPTGRYKLCTYTHHRDFDRFNWALALEATSHPSWRR